MSETMEYAVGDGVLYIKAPRRFCAPEAGNLLNEAGSILDEGGLTGARFDLSRCNYLDSTVMGQLVALHRKLGAGRLRLVKPSPDARQILLIMGLDKLLEISEDPLPELDYRPLLPQQRNNAHDVLEAHLLLSSLSRENAERFATLIQTLNQTIDKPE